MRLRNGIVLWGVIALLFCFMGSGIAAEGAGSTTVSALLGEYWFDDDQDLQDNEFAGLVIGRNLTENWGVEARFDFIDSSAEVTTTGTPEDVKVNLYHVDALYHFVVGEKALPYLAAGIGSATFDLEGEFDIELMMNYGAGIKYYIVDNIALRADVRHVITFDTIYHNIMASAGLTFLFGAPAKPMPMAAAPVRSDSDGDGVYDDSDACPGTPSGAPVDSSGCPLDSDNDGVPDYKDKCPNTASGAGVDLSGCPVDSDGDGVPDYMDKCMGTPSGATVDESGCLLDSDGDGVIDDADQCPNTPAGAEVDEKGCWTMRIIKGLKFASGKSIITEDSKKILDAVVPILENNPNLKLEIQGHTDSTGSKALNMSLSQERADAVKAYFVGKGVATDRLSTKGYGPDKPIAPNDTKAGRAVNRRVELLPVQ